MRKRYLVFDAYGTLLKVNAQLPGLTEAQQEQSAQLQEVWRSKQLEYTWLTSLMGRFDGFNTITKQALDYAFAYHQVKDDELKEQILGIFNEPSAFEDAIEFMRTCKEVKLPTAILSNGEEEMLHQSVAIAGIADHVDQLFSANQVQVFKPSPKVYQLPVDHFACEPQEVVFFSSNPWDVAGATHFGFTTVWINRNKLPFEELGVKPALECERLTQVDLNTLQALS